MGEKINESVSQRTPESPEGDKSGDKKYLYHRVPDDMEGNTLHPLGVLKETHPELYESKVSKYKDREHIMEQFIPTLEAMWNDVLHLTAVDPKQLKQALIDAGGVPKEMKFYQIDPKLLDPTKTTVYFYHERVKGEKIDPKHFSEFDLSRLTAYATMSQFSKDYYKESYQKG